MWVTSYCLQSCSWPWGFSDIIDWFKNIFQGKSSSKRSWEFLDAMWSSMEFLTGAQALWIAERLRWKLTSWAETIDLVSVIYYVGIGTLTLSVFLPSKGWFCPKMSSRKSWSLWIRRLILIDHTNKPGINMHLHIRNFKRLNDSTFRKYSYFTDLCINNMKRLQDLGSSGAHACRSQSLKTLAPNWRSSEMLRMNNTFDLHLQRIQTCDVKTTGLS